MVMIKSLNKVIHALCSSTSRVHSVWGGLLTGFILISDHNSKTRHELSSSFLIIHQFHKLPTETVGDIIISRQRKT